jgi:hypothetical protein
MTSEPSAADYDYSHHTRTAFDPLGEVYADDWEKVVYLLDLTAGTWQRRVWTP